MKREVHPAFGALVVDSDPERARQLTGLADGGQRVVGGRDPLQDLLVRPGGCPQIQNIVVGYPDHREGVARCRSEVDGLPGQF